MPPSAAFVLPTAGDEGEYAKPRSPSKPGEARTASPPAKVSPAPSPADVDEKLSTTTWLWYRFDLWIAKRQSQLITLVVAAFLQVSFGALILAAGPLIIHGDVGRFLTRIRGDGRFSTFWMSWSFLVNPGNHIGYSGAWERVVGVILTILGILYLSTVLGIVVDVIREKMDLLKVGKAVMERGHTVILGWSDRAPLIVAELILANESEGGGVVVILAEGPSKEAIEAELLHRFKGKMSGTRVVVRMGSPMLLQDLDKVAVEFAKCTIVLSETAGDADKADAMSLRKVLTLRSIDQFRGFALVEIRDVDNEPLVKLVGGDDVETLVSHDIIGRMMVMASRNPGLSRVYSEVLGFAGDEFYMHAFPEVDNVPFGHLQQYFPDAVPIGVASADENCIYLKPSVGRLMKPGEKIIVLAEDDDTWQPKPRVNADAGALPPAQRRPAKEELILFCGWRRDVRDIILHLDRLVKAGSRVHMCTDSIPLHERDLKLEEEGLHVAELVNLRIEHFNLNTAVRRRLEELPLEEYTSVMVFPDQAYEGDMMHSDSHAISTLLLVRDIQSKRNRRLVQNVTLLPSGTSSLISSGINKWRKTIGEQRCPMICEILDPRTQATVESNHSVAGSSDFMQSNRLVAQVLSMVSENRGVKVLLTELLAPEGAGFHVRPAREYVCKGERLTFYDLAHRTLIYRHEVLVGFQHAEDLATVINPRDKAAFKVWDHLDLVVLTGNSRLAGQDRTQAGAVLEAMMNSEAGDADAPPLRNGSFAVSPPGSFRNAPSPSPSYRDLGSTRSQDGSTAHCSPNDPTEARIQRARKTSEMSSVTAKLSTTLHKMRTPDLQWLQSRVQDELRTRDMKQVAPLSLPLDPSLQGLIDDLASEPNKQSQRDLRGATMGSQRDLSAGNTMRDVYAVIDA
ncbi:hypothetical protein M885DRAFT_511226 [Pelagophyceae sp. CCMP2097]|nr:hypothetical protein M885DRAFT_511226 [Pelagophyceae sp. CCMP2097]